MKNIQKDITYLYRNKQASTRSETSSYEVKQLRRPHIVSNLFYYEALARLVRRALSRKWFDTARDRWVVGMLNHFLYLHLNESFWLIMRRASEASLFFLGFPRKKKPLHNGSYEHRVPKIKKENILLYLVPGMCVYDSTS